VGACRCDAFVTALTGAEGDYDGEEITALDAALWLQAAGIEAVVGETASCTPEVPRWRVLLPASRAYLGSTDELRALRARWVARANGVLNGTLAGESFTLSQAFYIGGIEGRPKPTAIITRGHRIDLCEDLDANALFKNGKSEPTARVEHEAGPGDLRLSDDDPELLAECRRRVAAFENRCGRGVDPTGERSFRLVNWLADLGAGGLTPSARMIREAIGPTYPQTSLAAIVAMLGRRREPRGWDNRELDPEVAEAICWQEVGHD
jgi:hypothetical protein